MRRFTPGLLAIALFCPPAALTAQEGTRAACPWPDTLDAVQAAPDSHKVILENAHVRVLQVTVAPHSREPVHAHCLPGTLYIQQIGRIIDRDAQGRTINDGSGASALPPVPFAVWLPSEAPHSIENLDDQPLRMLRIEQKD